MAHFTRDTHILFNGNLCRLSTGKSGINSKQMNSILGQLEAMFSHHSKLHIIRFDLRLGIYADTSKMITAFNRRLFKWIKREYDLKRIGFTWCREQERAKHQHYHYVLILDGHKVRYPDKIIERVKKIWSTIGLSHWIPDNCYYSIERGNHQQTEEVIKRLSYLAKARGKGYKPNQSKNYGGSRIKARKIIA